MSWQATSLAIIALDLNWPMMWPLMPRCLVSTQMAKMRFLLKTTSSLSKLVTIRWFLEKEMYSQSPLQTIIQQCFHKLYSSLTITKSRMTLCCPTPQTIWETRLPKLKDKTLIWRLSTEIQSLNIPSNLNLNTFLTIVWSDTKSLPP